jgi:hypothetical protein
MTRKIKLKKAPIDRKAVKELLSRFEPLTLHISRWQLFNSLSAAEQNSLWKTSVGEEMRAICWADEVKKN